MNGSGRLARVRGIGTPGRRSNDSPGAWPKDILRLGLSVVLDFGLWARVERDEMRTAARDLGVGVELHYLEVPADELWRRIDLRNSAPPWDVEPIKREDLDEWLAIFQAPDAEELALFDRRSPSS
jgi:predicted kinase